MEVEVRKATDLGVKLGDATDLPSPYSQMLNLTCCGLLCFLLWWNTTSYHLLQIWKVNSCALKGASKECNIHTFICFQLRISHLYYAVCSRKWKFITKVNSSEILIFCIFCQDIARGFSSFHVTMTSFKLPMWCDITNCEVGKTCGSTPICISTIQLQ